ncbi:MAG: T9SS type A sorting domain-containing protein [Chlorobi bacterium]|nr:T9SS type A sorting domain-containing protein [Chlorobiota bacterium]
MIIWTMLFLFNALAQDSQLVRCGTTIHNITEEQREYLKQLDQAVAEYISQNFLRNSNLNSLPVITIPVVVHVLYSSPQENVSDNLIKALIDTMNKDFMSNRPEVLGKIDPMFRHLVGNPRIQFCLASVDPSGNPTNGIVRVQASSSCYNHNNSMKLESPPWDPSRYLNLWLVDFCSNLLGFATFPGEPSSTDGIVMDYRTLPGGAYTSFNEGRTIAHEIGHWMGLYHIWGDGDCTRDDGVGDTPPATDPQYNCPTAPMPQCNFPDRMVENYMDYSKDACLLMFTKGQALRMRAVMELDTRRSQLKYSNGCATPGTYDLAIVALKEKMYPDHTTIHLCNYKAEPVLTVKNIGAAQSPSSIIVCSAGGKTTTFNLPALNPNQQVNVTMPSINLPEGTYEIVCTVQSNDQTQHNNTMKYRVTTPVSCSYIEDFETAEYPSVTLHLDSVLEWWTYQWVLSPRNDIVGSDGDPTIAFMFPAYWAASGQTSTFKTPFIFLSPTTTNVTLSFDVAYAPYNTLSNEVLEVYVVDFCGLNTTRVGRWTGQQLATAPGTSNEWYPTSSSHWNTINNVDLTQFKGKTIAIAFKATSAKGNNIYIDNIRVQSNNCEPFVATPISTSTPQHVSIVPSGFIWNGTVTEIKITIYELSGKHILTKKEILRKGQKIVFNELQQGVYLLHLSDANSQKNFGIHKLTVVQ